MAARSYLIKVDGVYVIVDTGLWAQWNVLREGLSNNIPKNETLSYIILTHTHIDHVGNVDIVKKMYPDAKIVVHKYEEAVVVTGKTEIPKGGNIFMNLGLSLVRNILCNATRLCDIAPVYPDIVIPYKTDENEESWDGFSTKKTWITNNSYVTETPGHTKGSITYVCNNKYIVCPNPEMDSCYLNNEVYCFNGGDTIRGNMMADNFDELKYSVQRLREEINCDKFFQGHSQLYMNIKLVVYYVVMAAICFALFKSFVRCSYKVNELIPSFVSKNKIK